MTIKELYSNLPDLASINPKDAKAQLITHTDLDGVSCAIILGLYFPNLFVTYVDNAHMSETIKSAVQTESELMDAGTKLYDYIFVTDIAPTLEDAADIEFMSASKKLICLDHHPTSAKYLKHYKWAVNISNLLDDSPILAHYRSIDAGKDINWDGMLGNPGCCGTSLLFEYLRNAFKDYIPARYRRKVIDYVSLVTMYDTWAWDNIFKMSTDSDVCKINNLLYILGRDMFVNQFGHKLSNNLPYFDYNETFALLTDEHKRNEYLESLSQEEIIPVAIRLPSSEHMVYITVIHATQYIPYVFRMLENTVNSKGGVWEFSSNSDVGSLEHEVNLLGIVDGKKLSLRTPSWSNVHAGNFAALFGGGGHAKAAGIPFHSYDIESYIKNRLYQ